jgi:hypothetical protein
MSEAPNFVHTLAGLPKPGETLHHPDFRLVLQPLWHPDHDWAEQQVALTDSPYILAYYRSQNAVDHYLAQRMPAYGGLAYPHTKAERIYDLERMMSITTLMDDTTTNAETVSDKARRMELRGHYLDALAGTRPPDTAPIAQLLYEGLGPVREQLLSSTPRVWERMKDALRTLILAQTDPIALQLDTLTLERYLELRRVDNYGEWAALMTEYALDVDMTDALAADSSLTAMRTAAIDSITLVNDPYSFRKEIYTADTVNSVWLLMHRDGITLQEALNRLAALVSENERKILAARDRVLSGPLGQRDDVRAYVTELEHLASGNAEFHAISTRYHGRDFQGGRFISGEVTITPLPSAAQIAATDLAEG